MHGLKIHASIAEHRDGNKVTVSVTQDKQTREWSPGRCPAAGKPRLSLRPLLRSTVFLGTR